MFSHKQSSLVQLSVLASLLLLGIVLAAPSAHSRDRSDQMDQKPVPSDELIMLNHNDVYLGGVDCSDDEIVEMGRLPECEPTCENPQPICPKIFAILDHPFCFCKEPLVRHKASNRCIPLEKCNSANLDSRSVSSS